MTNSLRIDSSILLPVRAGLCIGVSASFDYYGLALGILLIITAYSFIRFPHHFLIPVGDTEAMADAMSRVLDDKALRKHLAEAGFRPGYSNRLRISDYMKFFESHGFGVEKYIVTR